MLKNVCLIVALTWMSLSHAKPQVVAESMHDSAGYKVEKPVQEQDAKRSVAGGKFKKGEKQSEDKSFKEPNGDSDSEVRYWQYSE